jgi:hypothetical protein
VKYVRSDIQEKISSAEYTAGDMGGLLLVSDGEVLPSVLCSGSASVNSLSTEVQMFYAS